MGPWANFPGWVKTLPESEVKKILHMPTRAIGRIRANPYLRVLFSDWGRAPIKLARLQGGGQIRPVRIFWKKSASGVTDVGGTRG